MKMKKLLATTLATIAIISLQVSALEENSECEIPKEFPNGKLRPVEREYRGRSIVPAGIRLQFKCNEEYTLTGESFVTCVNGAWLPQIPTCAPLQVGSLENDGNCEIPKEFPNGKLRPIERKYRGHSIVPAGIRLQFKCNEEYVLTGVNFVTCISGAWLPQLPTCTPESVPENEVKCEECCKIPRNFTNGKIILVHTKLYGHSLIPENGQLQFSCDPGYVLSGINGSLCLQGVWLPEIPLCVRNSCLPPPSLEHGRIVSDFEGVFPLGANISYECDDGYQLVQESVLICDKDFSWKGEMPECKEIVKCEDPGQDPNGYRAGKCCEMGDVLNYTCVEEYEIPGPSAIICTDAGTWNGSRPRCQPDIFCDVPEKIPNGQFHIVKNGNISLRDEGAFFLPDDEVMIICDKGYTVGNQSDYLYCGVDGKWDEDIPECRVAFFCDIPEPPENGYIIELEKNKNLSSVPYGFEINFACHPRYRLIGSSWRLCAEYGWTTENPRCEEIMCPDPGKPEDGWTQGTDFRIGNETYFGCFSGYNLLGSHRRVCLENGQWSGELSRCDKEDNYCPNPGIPIGGTKMGTRYDLDSEVQFHCNPGRILIGSANRMCRQDREWSGEEAKCFSEDDFDDKRAVGVRIRSFLHDASVNQEVSRSRSIDLNFPGRLIFVFIFDVSGSVGESDFNRSIAFAKAIVKAIRMNQSGARVGAITFSSKADIEINPVDHDSEEKVLTALNKIEYKKGGTATSSALLLLKGQMMPLTIEVLGKDCKFKVFLMTDGKANMAGNPIHDAKALKDDGVEIFCIGITGDRRMATLHDIASSKDKHVFILDGYESLNWLVEDIINEKIDYSKCGVRRSTVAEIKEEDKRSRIINGKVVVKNWPWMAAMLIVDPLKPDASKPRNICGASLISHKWLLTAAHCMHPKNKLVWRSVDEFIILLGVTDLGNSSTLQKNSIARYISHPKYSWKTMDYDIALVELSFPATYNEFIRPVCLPPSANDINTEPTFYSAGQKVAVVGWGHDKAYKADERPITRFVQVARRIIVTMQRRGVCADSLKNHPKNYVFTDQMICAGGDGMDACSGDSGGPLMLKLESDIGEEYWTAVGIVSWGIGCGQPGVYGFYTKVSVFTEWIEDVMEGRE